MKFLKILTELYKLYKSVDAADPKASPTTVVIEAGSKAAATKIADAISKDNPTVNIVVSTVTAVGVTKLEELFNKKVLKK